MSGALELCFAAMPTLHCNAIPALHVLEDVLMKEKIQCFNVGDKNAIHPRAFSRVKFQQDTHYMR